MNLTPKSINVDPLCVGCLSSDRKLTNLDNKESRAMYCDFIWENNWSEEPSFLICFECKATLLRIVNFKKQVKVAHNVFLCYLNNGIKPKSLSKLSIKNNSIINNDRNESFHFLKNEESSNDMKDTNVASAMKQLNDTRINDNIEPVFVKMENKVEELFLEDDFQNDDIDSIEINVKMEDNFQDSDDEPLSNVKKKKIKKKKIKKGVRKSRPLQEDMTRVVKNARVERKLQQLNVDSGLIEMVVLSWDEVESERVEALKSDVYSKLAYRCEDCALGFNHRAKLHAHMNKHLPEAGDIMCNVCKIRFKNEKSLYAHKRRHRVRWRCIPCGRLWSRAAVCADHAHRTHGTTAPTHACSYCSHTAPTLGKLKLHMRSHSEPVSCEICGKTYQDKDTLRTHLFIHKGEKEYECKKCEKKFLFKKALELHDLSHGGNQYLYCHQCDVTFKNQLSYYQHMKYNLKHIDPEKITHECPYCGRMFARASRLAEHARVVHARVDAARDVHCTQPGCHKSFRSRGSLRSHRATSHRRDLAPAHTHVCHTCGHKYKSKKSLECHVRSHTGERPYTCSVSPCAATFAHQAALYRHLKLVHRVTTKKKQDNPPVTTTHLQM